MTNPFELADAESLYRAMTSPELEEYREALRLDRKAGADPAFCGARIALIDRILRERVRDQ